MSSENTGFTQMLARHIVNTRYDDIPQEAIHQAKRVIADMLGCALGGSLTDAGRIAIAVTRELGGAPDSTVVGSGHKTSCGQAAYANARMGNILDAEETYYTNTHFGSPAVFVSLALTERNKASGRDLITAMVLGFDLAARTSMTIGNPFMSEQKGVPNPERYTIPDDLTFAAVGAASKALGLNEEQTCHAIGTAGANSPLKARYVMGMLRGKTPQFKYGDYGWCAMNGIMAALNAQKGFTAFPFFLDEDSSYWQRYKVEKNFDLLVGKLGQRWGIMDVVFKPWPACRLTHPALTVFTKIIEEHKLVPSEIDRVTVYASNAAKNFAGQDTPDMTSSQFTFPHPITMAAFRITPGPEWYTPNVFKDPKLLEFRKKVFTEVHPAADRLAEWCVDGQWRQLPARVVVEARGQTFEGETDWAKGDPWLEETYFTDQDIRAKFKNFAGPVATASEKWHKQMEQIVDMVYDLENVKDVRELTRLLAP